MEQVQTEQDLKQKRISLIESISKLRKQSEFPPIDAEEFDAMYDAPLWILERYNRDLSLHLQLTATEM